MEEFPIHVATEADETRVIDAIVLAFAGDPVARWIWPDPHDYLRNMPGFTRAFGGVALAQGTAYRTEDWGGAALWIPPNAALDEEVLGELLEKTVAPAVLADLLAVFEHMAENHPTDPHWYLPLIGVDPAHQGRGHGGTLMAYALSQCDRDRAPAYLESTNPRNVSLYQRHGFEALSTIQIGSSPPLVPMLRAPR